MRNRGQIKWQAFESLYKTKEVKKAKEENPKKLEDLLKNVTFNIDNYIYKCKEFQNNGLYVTIKATDSNNKQVTYSVPLTMNNVCTDK